MHVRDYSYWPLAPAHSLLSAVDKKNLNVNLYKGVNEVLHYLEAHLNQCLNVMMECFVLHK